MKKVKTVTVLIVVLASIFALSLKTYSQDRIPKSPRAEVTQNIGLDGVITFDYSRPGVKGRKIWGELEPYGLHPGNKYSKDKPYPWRVGADKNTTIESNKDLLVEGKKLPAGKYSIHMIPSEKKAWVVIFSKKNEEWGSYSYDQNEDALRIEVTPLKTGHMEWLFLGFEELTDNSAIAFMHWEKLKVPFKIELAK
ncbi:DUF2911 domain-containing protein [Bacteroidota bacterium]